VCGRYFIHCGKAGAAALTPAFFFLTLWKMLRRADFMHCDTFEIVKLLDHRLKMKQI
jgi:hypothetical protein